MGPILTFMSPTYFHDDLEEVGGGDLVGICQTLVDIYGVLFPAVAKSSPVLEFYNNLQYGG